MPCETIGTAIVCGPSGPYIYKGIMWEWHSYHGPHPIRKSDLAPWDRVPETVWAIADEFAREDNKATFLVHQEVCK